MFFIGGVSSKQVKLDFIQKMICSHCGQYGSYEVFDEYIYLSLFFIPILKWNRKYYVKSTCCGSVYSISEELGRRMEKGEHITLTNQDLQLITKRCPNCGCEIDEEYKFCPNCAAPLK